MKSTENFKKVISAHLEYIAANDSLFAETLKKENKNIDDCITYILNTVQKSGSNGFEDQEIFSMAIHYYDEDDLKAGPPISCQVISNHVVEITEEEKALAKKEALRIVVSTEMQRITKKTTKKVEQKQGEQVDLFA